MFSNKFLVGLLGAVALIHCPANAGIYSGPTDTATFNSLLSQVQAQSVALSNKVAQANLAGVNTDYAQVSQVTLKIFKNTYAPYDRANSNAIVAKYNANTFISQKDPVGPIGLPFDELADCLEVATNAIAELQAQIDGAIVLSAPPNFATGGVTLNGTHYEQGGKTVFPHYFFWHPFDEDIMRAYGRMGEGYLAITDMQNLNTAKNFRYSSLVNLMASQKATNRTPAQFFLGHVDYGSSWHRTTYPAAFSVGKRLFTDYDIDYPLVPTWLNYLFTNMLVGAVSALGSQERIHMLANEPVWSIRQGGVDANQGVSSYTTAKLATWLQNKYTTTNNLNATWGTSHASFSAAANANYGASGLGLNLQGGPIWYDWCRFNMSRVNDWFTFLNSSVKSLDPAGRTHIKVMGERSVHTKYHDEGIDFEFVNNLVDMPGADNQMTSGRAKASEYYQRTDAGDWYNRYNLEWREQSLMIDFVKSINPEKPYYDSEWHGLSGSRWRDFHMEPAYVREALWLVFTHGVSAMNAWVWCRYDGTEGAGYTNGQPQNGSDFFGESATQPLQLDAWGRTMKELNAHGDAVKSLVPQQRYYVLYYCEDAAIQDANYTATLKDVYESLKLLNVPVGFTTPAKLASVNNLTQTVIIPPTKFIASTNLAALQTFVAGGGKIVLVNSNQCFTKTELGANRAGGAGFTPLATVTTNNVYAMADALAAALATRKPALPMVLNITTNGQPAYGVLGNQFQIAGSTNQVCSLINVSKDPRTVTISLQSGAAFDLNNLITGKLLANHTIIMQPQDVLLLGTAPSTYVPPAYLVNDDFSAPTLNPTIWNAGTGFGLSNTTQNVLLSTSGTGWGSKGDSSGAAGLNSTVGYASFTVASNGVTPLGGNFLASYNTNFNTANALVNVSFVTGGAGTYEILWNNSGVTLPFTMPISGWSGSIGGNSTVWIVNGNTGAAHWATATAATYVAAGNPANRFGFWINQNSQAAVIDNVRIADTLMPGTTVVAPPLLQVSKSGTNVVLIWSGTGFKLQYQTNMGTSWTDHTLPAGTNPPVNVPMSGNAKFFRLSQ